MSFGLGEFFSLLSAIGWATAVILYKASGDSFSARSLNLVKNSIGVALLIPTAAFIHGLNFPDLTSVEWLILIASGYFGIAIADTWYLQALRYLGAGRTAIIASLYSPFVVTLSIVFLGESLALWQWLGFGLVLVGILIVVYQRKYSHVDHQALSKGLVLAASSVFLTAAGVVAMKPLLGSEGFFWMVALRLLAGTVGMILVLMLTRRLHGFYIELTEQTHHWHMIIPAALAGTYFALIFWLAGFKYADASIASVLNETSNVFIVLMAWMFLREPLTGRKLIGVICTFAGVMVFLGGFK